MTGRDSHFHVPCALCCWTYQAGHAWSVLVDPLDALGGADGPLADDRYAGRFVFVLVGLPARRPQQPTRRGLVHAAFQRQGDHHLLMQQSTTE